MRIVVGSDHIGRPLKDVLCEHLRAKGLDVADLGVCEDTPVEYPDIAVLLSEEIARGQYDRGILVCGTGIGMAIVANKVPGVRAAVVHDSYSAERSRKSNDAQVMTMGSLIVGAELAKSLLDIWLASEFSGGRSAPKVEKIKAIDQRYHPEP
jgi:ribose 5-phosphate isomerase B